MNSYNERSYFIINALIFERCLGKRRGVFGAYLGVLNEKIQASSIVLRIYHVAIRCHCNNVMNILVLLIYKNTIKTLFQMISKAPMESPRLLRDPQEPSTNSQE